MVRGYWIVEVWRQKTVGESAYVFCEYWRGVGLEEALKRMFRAKTEGFDGVRLTWWRS